MNSDNISIEQANNQGYIVKLDNKIYSKEAVLSASNKFTDFFYVTVNIENDKLILSFEPKEQVAIADTKIKEFCNEVLEQQVRENLNHKFGDLRNSIYSKAFSFIQE